MERQNEIEIYVRDCALEDMLQWAGAKLGGLSKFSSAGDITIYESPCGLLFVTPGIENGPFVSLWFATASSPWNTDVDCARDAARELECTVRCDPGQHYPEVPPQSPRFLEIKGKNERLAIWA